MWGHMDLLSSAYSGSLGVCRHEQKEGSQFAQQVMKVDTVLSADVEASFKRLQQYRPAGAVRQGKSARAAQRASQPIRRSAKLSMGALCAIQLRDPKAFCCTGWASIPCGTASSSYEFTTGTDGNSPSFQEFATHQPNNGALTSMRSPCSGPIGQHSDRTSATDPTCARPHGFPALKESFSAAQQSYRH